MNKQALNKISVNKKKHLGVYRNIRYLYLRLILKAQGSDWHYVCLQVLILTWGLRNSLQKNGQQNKVVLILNLGIELPSAWVMGIGKISVKKLFVYYFLVTKNLYFPLWLLDFFLCAIWLPQKLVANFGPLSRGTASQT